MTAEPPVSFRAFNAAMKRAGFQKEYSSRAGGGRVDEWKRQENDRRIITVQLWGDGKHRVTHSIDHNENTYPTGFTDVEGMLAAITRERERTDNYKLAQIAAQTPGARP